VNWQHFQAFLWLRWRLLINQLRRGGFANVVILTLLAIGGVLLALGMFVAFFLVGLFLLPNVSPGILLYVWDGLIIAFLFSWSMGLIMELQRSEALSMEKLLHLPVSLKGVFLINYLTSLFNLTLLGFLPGMIALSLALVMGKGPRLLLLFPLLAGFILMVTAVTFQFQGWLASLMANPRRRRTVMVMVPLIFALICQVPNLINVVQPWNAIAQQEKEAYARWREEQTELDNAAKDGKVSGSQYLERERELQQKQEAGLRELNEQMSQRAERVTWFLNLCLPPGWLPLGAMAAAEGNVWSALLAAVGLTLLGTASLWRSYQTTVRLYTGHFTAKKRAPAAVVAAPKTKKSSGLLLLERKLPWLSEQASVVALGGLRSLLRAPEAKMMLLSPLIMVVVFGSIFLANSIVPPQSVRPLLAFGAVAMILLSMAQIIGNQFGFDRSGFRVFVLSAVPRRDILLGKNLACAPFVLGLGAVVIAVVQVLCPLRFDNLLAVVPQSISMFLLFCLLANGLSIFAPVRLRSGSSQPANMRGLSLLLHLLFIFLYPLILGPTLLPWGIEFALEELGAVKGVPIYLVLSLLECAVVVWLYRLVLTWQGDILQGREQKILEIVTTKTE
jgi:ABC-2 type transport system permease protein